MKSLTEGILNVTQKLDDINACLGPAIIYVAVCAVLDLAGQQISWVGVLLIISTAILLTELWEIFTDRWSPRGNYRVNVKQSPSTKNYYAYVYVKGYFFWDVVAFVSEPTLPLLSERIKEIITNNVDKVQVLKFDADGNEI